MRCSKRSLQALQLDAEISPDETMKTCINGLGYGFRALEV